MKEPFVSAQLWLAGMVHCRKNCSERHTLENYVQETDMKTAAGLWIDHRKAVIVFVSDEREKTMEIRSNVEKQPGRFEGVRRRLLTKHNRLKPMISVNANLWASSTCITQR